MEKENTSIYEKIMYGLIAIILLILIGTMIFKMVKNNRVENPRVTFNLEGKGNIVIELYPKKAPNTVNNFINLVNSGWYNGKLYMEKILIQYMLEETKKAQMSHQHFHLLTKI